MVMRILAILSLGVLVACETVEGVGRDIQAGGSAIEDASNEVQNDL